MDKCEDCANNDTLYCDICQENDFFMTKEQKNWNDYMCDILCGGYVD